MKDLTRDIPVIELLDWTLGEDVEPPDKLTQQERDLLLDLKNLPEERRELLLHVLQMMPFKDVMDEI